MRNTNLKCARTETAKSFFKTLNQIFKRLKTIIQSVAKSFNQSSCTFRCYLYHKISFNLRFKN